MKCSMASFASSDSCPLMRAVETWASVSLATSPVANTVSRTPSEFANRNSRWQRRAGFTMNRWARMSPQYTSYPRTVFPDTPLNPWILDREQLTEQMTTWLLEDEKVPSVTVTLEPVLRYTFAYTVRDVDFGLMRERTSFAHGYVRVTCGFQVSQCVVCEKPVVRASLPPRKQNIVVVSTFVPPWEARTYTGFV